ncbi:hypothetical protein [Streptomyces sp. NPDC057580]|uniref:hypothetical protein n=1 Tax=Streptomyces sp. NPDC057580 TaxID=3346173 RepID=UPI00369245E3
MSLYLGPVLAISIGLLYTVNPRGLGDAAFRHLNKYPRIGLPVEAARRQAYVLGRAMFAIGVGWIIWVLLLDINASHIILVSFMAVAIPSAFVLVCFTIIDTIRRATSERQR